MTGTNDKVRSLFLAAIMVLSVFAMATAFSGTVAAEDRTIGAGNAAPVVVFPNEQVDLSSASPSVGGESFSGTIQLSGISGEADGELIDDSASDFDFTGASPGGYDLSGGDDQADVIVREPQVNSVSLFRGAGNTNPNAEVTDGNVPEGQSTITVRANWNFDDYLDPISGSDSTYVVLFDDQGVELSGEVNMNPSIGDLDPTSDDPTGIMLGASSGTGSPGQINIAGIDNLDTGTYTVAVAGISNDGYADNGGTSPSPFADATATAQFTITDPGETIELRQTEVTRGTTVTGDVTGNVGDNVFVRMRTGNNISGADDTDIFRSTSEVVGTSEVTIDEVDYFRAELELEERGSAPFQINTTALEADTTTTFEVTDGPGQVSPNATADLTVNAREVSVTDMPNAVVIGEEFEIQGEAPRSDRVKAWARIGSSYEPLETPAGVQATDSVSGDGSFELEIDSSEVIDLPESYRVVITADEEQNEDADLDAGDTEMTSSQLNELDVRTTTSLRTVTGELSVRLSSNTIASGVADEIEMEGNALGQGDTVRLYIVGPRGEVTDAGGASFDQLESADTISVVDQAFEDELAAFDIRGTYQIAVAGPGRNQGFEAADDADLDGRTQSEAMEVLQDEYDQPGSDDVLVVETVQAQNAMLTIDDFRENGQVEQGSVELSGQSNRQDETLVFLEVIDENDDVVVSSEGEVNGSSNTWSGEIDLSEVEPGTYELRADDDEAAATLEFELVEEVEDTPTETETDDTPTETETDDTPTETETDDTPTDTETETTDGEQQPGFTLVIGLIALVAAALLAVRRNS